MARRKNTQLVQNKLTPEGWVFLVVLAFITIGAIMRNVNLLVLMAGMMFVSLLLNWRLARHRLSTLSAKRRLPKRIHAKEMINVMWVCSNLSRRISGWNIVLKDRIDRVDESLQLSDTVEKTMVYESNTWWSKLFGEIMERFGRRKISERSSKVSVCFPVVASGQTEARSYRTFFGRRGKYTIGPALLSTSFPFGLIVSRFQFPEVETFFVGPELGNLEPTWEKRIQSIASGSETVKRRRALEEDEFYALRPWRSGDSKKNIHWRTTAKVGQPIIKQYDQQNNRDFGMVLDLFIQDQADDELERCELAIQFGATALVNIWSDVQGQVTLGICGVETEICSSRTQLGILSDAIRGLAVAKATSDPETLPAIIRVASMVSNGTPVYVVSSRPKPEMLEPGYWANGNQENSRLHDRSIRGVKHVLHLIRWLHVDSPEFKAMFTQKQMGEQLEAVAKKWSDNKSSAGIKPVAEAASVDAEELGEGVVSQEAMDAR